MANKVWGFLKMAVRSFALAVPGIILLYLTILVIGLPVRWGLRKLEPGEIGHFNKNRTAFEEILRKFREQDKIEVLLIDSSGSMTRLNDCKVANTSDKLFYSLGKLRGETLDELPGDDEMLCSNSHGGSEIVRLDEIFKRYDLQKADIQWFAERLKPLKYQGIGRHPGEHERTLFYRNQRIHLSYSTAASPVESSAQNKSSIWEPGSRRIDKNWDWVHIDLEHDFHY